MTMEQKISMALAYKGISQAALAREMGTTPSNFNQKLKRGTFSVEEMEKMATALGAKYFFGFEFEDGTKVRVLFNTCQTETLEDDIIIDITEK